MNDNRLITTENRTLQWSVPPGGATGLPHRGILAAATGHDGAARHAHPSGARYPRAFLSAAAPAHAHASLDWKRFSAITFSHSLTAPVLNTVTCHHFRSMRLAMRHLKRLGYRRIGLVCSPAIMEMGDRNWAAAFWAYQPTPYQLAVPILSENP